MIFIFSLNLDFFFFKQKTAYEMRISDWSSDVCSSDLCSFNAAILGAFYGREMAKVRAEGRIDPAIESVAGEPVHRAWDIGVRDDTSIWWFQVVGSQLFILDCYSENGVGVDHYADRMSTRLNSSH